MNNKVWVVTNPTIGCSLSEIMYEVTATELARQVTGSGLAEFEKGKPRLHLSRDAAFADVKARLELAFDLLHSVLGDGPSRKASEAHASAVAAMFDQLVSLLMSQPADVVIGALSAFMTPDLASALRLRENKPYMDLVAGVQANIHGLVPGGAP